MWPTCALGRPFVAAAGEMDSGREQGREKGSEQHETVPVLQ